MLQVYQLSFSANQNLFFDKVEGQIPDTFGICPAAAVDFLILLFYMFSGEV